MKRSGRIDGRALVAAQAGGRALVLEQSLSFWGGLDTATGEIIDRRHPQHGACVTGRIVVMPAGRGSSSSSTVLAEAIRLGTAPAGILLVENDSIIVVGALVAADLYGRVVPVVQVPTEALTALSSGAMIAIDEDGTIAYEEDAATPSWASDV